MAVQRKAVDRAYPCRLWSGSSKEIKAEDSDSDHIPCQVAGLVVGIRIIPGLLVACDGKPFGGSILFKAPGISRRC